MVTTRYWMPMIEEIIIKNGSAIGLILARSRYSPKKRSVKPGMLMQGVTTEKTPEYDTSHGLHV